MSEPIGVDTPSSVLKNRHDTTVTHTLHGQSVTRIVSRRAFVRALAAAVPVVHASRVFAATNGVRALSFVHTHTAERLAVEYAAGNDYIPDGLAAVNHFLRDFRTNEVHPIDTGLLDLLHGLAMLTGTGRPFEVISGYRSPKTNAMLRQRSEGVAAGSLHVVGQAIDIRLRDVPLEGLKRAALEMHRGGVGYYPKSEFVHVDTGRVRTW
jgi:uncharacterized protein YcbK (DUF882 family)